MKIKITFSLLFFMIFVASCGPKKLETAEMTIKNEKFLVELARTQEEQQLGLMFRKSLGDREGMLFIYDEWVKHGFWMKNTSIPLSIAFIGGDGKILDIKEMQPYSERGVKPGYSYRYALEVNQGTFKSMGVNIGDYVELPAILLH